MYVFVYVRPFVHSYNGKNVQRRWWRFDDLVNTIDKWMRLESDTFPYNIHSVIVSNNIQTECTTYLCACICGVSHFYYDFSNCTYTNTSTCGWLTNLIGDTIILQHFIRCMKRIHLGILVQVKWHKEQWGWTIMSCIAILRFAFSNNAEYHVKRNFAVYFHVFHWLTLIYCNFDPIGLYDAVRSVYPIGFTTFWSKFMIRYE